MPSTRPPSISVFYLLEPAIGDKGFTTVDTAGTGMIVDFRDSPPSTLPVFVDQLRDITTQAHSRGKSVVALVVPPIDTVMYPTEVLSRAVDAIIVRAYGDHRPGTLPGAPTTADFITRAIGIRSRTIGPARVIAALPLFGYRWESNGSARLITYAQAAADLNSEARAFRRDPATQYLVANGRDGWTAWVPDGTTIEYLIGLVRQRGIAGIALAGRTGAAPDVAGHVDAAIRR
jgi:spore germination protein YaaH